MVSVTTVKQQNTIFAGFARVLQVDAKLVHS
jgi:hypothetical protein